MVFRVVVKLCETSEKTISRHPNYLLRHSETFKFEIEETLT